MNETHLDLRHLQIDDISNIPTGHQAHLAYITQDPVPRHKDFIRPKMARGALMIFS